MYKFKRLPAPGFMLVESMPAPGDSHIKRFLPGTTPSNQGTLNLYLGGRFSFAIPSAGFSQVMQPGQTNLDIGIDAFPTGQDAVETSVAADCWRMCLSPESPQSRWSRRVVNIEPGGSLSISGGDLAIVILGAAAWPGGVLNVGGVIYPSAPTQVTSSSSARIAIARLL